MNKLLKQCLAPIYQWEGGYINHPADKGGATKYGITQATYHAYRKQKGLAIQDVKQLTYEEADAIYAADYAAKIAFEALPAGLNLALLDFAIHAGVSRAVKALQVILGVAVDGIMGSESLAAIHNHKIPELIKKLYEKRIKMAKNSKNYAIFGKGWLRRFEALQAEALKLYGSDTNASDTQALVIASEKAIDAPAVWGEPAKMSGELSWVGAVRESRRSQAAVLAGLGGFGVLLTQGLELAQQFGEALPQAAQKLAPVTTFTGGTVGAVLTIAGAAYIVWLKRRKG